MKKDDMTPDEKQNVKEKSLVAEAKFKGWLDSRRMPYWYIRQDLETFSPALKKYFGSKRPDFMILIPHFGFMLVDVKNYIVNPKYNTIAVNCEETASYSNLHRSFNLPVWFAVSNEKFGYKKWLWAPASKFLEIDKKNRHPSKNGDFFAVPMKEFIEVGFQDSMGALFAKCFE